MDRGEAPYPPDNADYGSGPYGAVGYAGAYKSDSISRPSPTQRPSYFHTVSLGLLVLLPAMMFSLVSMLFSFLYHRLPAACWTFIGLCLCTSFLFMLARPVRDGPRYWFNLGCLCLLATAAAYLASFWNLHKNFDMYWAYDGQRSYANVSPSDQALARLDAGKLLFNSEARVDPTAAVGIVDGDRRYCVAPIVAGARTGRVQFWAAGVNCCGADGTKFACDEVGSKYAHSGLVFLDYGKRADWLEMFRRAASEAGASHGAVPAKDALFVSWVEDPEVAQQAFWSEGVRFLVGTSLTYLGASAIIGSMLHFGGRARAAKSKLESRTAL
mmetsp:Transcript_29290/g.83254  ORF Transcript_29290/g.83254 Transcript_29290/m.83254 type:complete len:327 (+) Transcript_29290:138-1118(+)